jgi:hypothetical protein
MADIDAYLHFPDSHLHNIKRVVREIQSKSGVGALLHPAEEYFVEIVLAIPQP